MLKRKMDKEFLINQRELLNKEYRSTNDKKLKDKISKEINDINQQLKEI